MFWNGVFIQPLEEKRIMIKNEEYDITSNIQNSFTNTKLTTKSFSYIEKETVFDTLNIVGFYDMKHTKQLNSTRMKNASYNLPKTITKNLNPPLTEIENIKDSYEEEISDNDLGGQGIEKFIIPSNINDINTRLEVLVGLKICGHSDTLTEACTLIDELYKWGELKNKQHYRNALDKCQTQKMELPSKVLEQIALLPDLK